MVVLLAFAYGYLGQPPVEPLLLGGAALLAAGWGLSRRTLGQRVRRLRSALQRAEKGELDVRLEASGEPAWDAIAEAFNSTMAKLERELQQRSAALLEALDRHAIGIEGELRDKDKRLELVIEGAGLAVWDWEIPGDRVRVDERWAALLGRDAAGAPKRLDDWRRLVHPEDLAQVETALQRHLDGETPAFSAELRLRGRDGQWVWILDSGRVTRRDAAGRPLRATGIHLDITKRKRAEQALAAERSRLELVLRAGRIGFWDWDVKRGTVDTNDVVQALFGALASGFRTMREWFALIHPEDREEFAQAARACLDGREASFRQIARWRTARGWVWLRTQSQVTARDAGGRALRMMGVHIDIDEQRRAEERIREQEERLRLVVDCAALGIWDWDMTTGRVESNGRLAQMLGYEPGELQTQASLAALAHPDDAALLNEATRAHLQGRSPFFSAEVRLRGKHGQWMWVLSRGRIARRDAQGRAVRMAGIHFDVTERHVAALERDRLQAQLQQAQKMEALGQLTGGIAHDFNNILASILGYASLAHGRYAGDNLKLAEYLAAVIAAGERARDLIAKMLVFSRDTPRESGSSMDVAALVREVATLLASVIPSSITIAVDVAAEVPRVQLGATDLHQVLVNLAVNARDAMGESGRLDITVAAVRCGREVCSTCHELIDGDCVEIVCRDTGSGMDEALLKRVFEPFFTTKEVGKGTGMGLAVVHGIVHRAGGHLRVESTPGVGTAFRLLLPPALARADDTQVRASADPIPRRAPARSGRILVVDDEAPIAGYLRELLESQGHEVTVAHDGQAALARLRERPRDFDLVITDQTMPKLSGVGLVKALRALRADLPAVLCTGFSDTIDLRGARALGVRRFLRKPVEAPTMLRVVSELLETAPAPAAPRQSAAASRAVDAPRVDPSPRPAPPKAFS